MAIGVQGKNNSQIRGTTFLQGSLKMFIKGLEERMPSDQAIPL